MPSETLSMRLDHLRVRNFRALREVDIDIPDGVVGILGPNGTGKSSLLVSILYSVGGLDGLTYKKDALIGPAEEDAWVELGFSVGGQGYVVERKLRRKDLVTTAVLRSADGTEMANGTEAVSVEMTRLLGSLAEWKVSRFVAQKQVNALSVLDPAPRKRLILRLLGVESVEGAAQRLRDQVNEIDRTVKSRRAALPRVDVLSAEVRTAEMEIARLERDVTAAKTSLAAAERRANDDAATLAADDELAATLAVAREALHGHERLADERESSLTRVRERIAAGDAVASELAELGERVAAAEGGRGELHDLERAASIRAQVPELEARQADMGRRIERANSEMTRASGDQQRLGAVRARLAELATELPSVQAARDAAAGERADLRARLVGARDSATRAKEAMHSFEGGTERNCPVCHQTVADPLALRKDLAAELAKAEALVSRVTGAGLAARSTEEAAEAALAGLTEEAERLRGEVETLADAPLRLAHARADLDDARSAQASATESLALAGATAYDEDRHLAVRALVDSLADLISLRGALHQRAADAVAAQAELPEAEERASESQDALEATRARLAASGYDPDLHERHRTNAEASRNTFELGRAALTSLEAESHTAAALLARDRRALEEHANLAAEIERLLTERGSGEAARAAMEAFKTALIGRIRPALERRASVLLRELSDGRYADLALDADYEISIGSGNALRSIRDISGGEEDLANLCLRIAISQLITESAGLGSTFIVLDEVLGSQDETRQEAIMEMLPRLANHFGQVLMVAHLPAVQDRFATTLRGEWDPETSTSRFVWPSEARTDEVTVDVIASPASAPKARRTKKTPVA